MSIVFRILIVLLIIAGGYSLFGIVYFKWMDRNVQNPAAEFLVTGNPDGEATFVEFTYYPCGWCKEVGQITDDAMNVRKDLRHVIRPVIFLNEEDERGDELTKIALAAGLQGKFLEMHNAFLEYPELDIPDDFIEETALLYGIDYEQLIEDSKSKKVEKIAKKNLQALEHTGIPSVPSFYINNKTYVIDERALELKEILTIITNSEKY